MANKRDLKLEDYGISLSRYRELYYFCQQYDEKREALNQCYGIKAARFWDMPRANKRDVGFVEQQAEYADKLSRDVKLIEQTAQEADQSLYQFLLKNVTQDIKYEHMGVPCGRRQFYLMRRKFFYLLNLKRG